MVTQSYPYGYTHSSVEAAHSVALPLIWELRHFPYKGSDLFTVIKTLQHSTPETFAAPRRPILHHPRFEVPRVKDIITRKYRLVVKTVGYIGWSLFWLLIWDVLVTIDFMLFFNSKFTLPLIPLTLRLGWWCW